MVQCHASGLLIVSPVVSHTWVSIEGCCGKVKAKRCVVGGCGYRDVVGGCGPRDVVGGCGQRYMKGT